MTWGKWIIVSFVLFATFIGTLVTVCVRQDVSLVAKEYYRDELDFESQLEREANGAALHDKPSIRFVGGDSVQVHFARFDRLQRGTLTLYAPADARHDRIIHLASSSTPTQAYDVANLHRGMYKAQLRWSMDGREFFVEETIYR